MCYGFELVKLSEISPADRADVESYCVGATATSFHFYANDRGQSNLETAIHQHRYSKLAEYAAEIYLKRLGAEITYRPDPKVIRDGKSFHEPDMRCIPYQQGAPVSFVMVKSQNAVSARRFGLSWTFDILGKQKETGYLVLVRVDDEQPDTRFEIMGTPLFEDVKGYLDEPQKDSLKQSKSVLYYETLKTAVVAGHLRQDRLWNLASQAIWGKPVEPKKLCDCDECRRFRKEIQ